MEGVRGNNAEAVNELQIAEQLRSDDPNAN